MRIRASYATDGLISRKRAGVVLAALLVVGGPRVSLGAEHSEEARRRYPEPDKLRTEDAEPVEAGEFEVEIQYGYRFTKGEFNESGERVSKPRSYRNAVELEAAAGVTNDLELRVGGGWENVRGEGEEPDKTENVGDVEVGAKWRFLTADDEKLEVAYVPGLSVPLGKHEEDRELNPLRDEWNVSQRLVVTRHWNRDFTTNLEGGFAVPFTGDRKRLRGIGIVNLAFGYRMTPWLQPEFEVNYRHDLYASEVDTNVLAITGGFLVQVVDALRVDVGFFHDVAGRETERETAILTRLVFEF